MKIAILLLCHKNPTQINMFIDLMQNDSFDLFIHVDKKSDIVDQIKKSNNVYFLPDNKRIDVGWASISQIKATHNLILFAKKKCEYDYYWLCSGQDLPLKNCQQILDFFISNNNKNFINLIPSKHNGLNKENNYDKRNAIYYYDFFMGREKWKSVIRRLYVALTGGYLYTFPWFKRKYKNFRFYFGSQWWCINKETMNWIIEYEKNNPDYFVYYSHCSTPDESYYHTLVMNSPFALNRNDYLHYIIWNNGASSPQVFTINDKNILEKTNLLMARKFDMNVDAEIISWIINKNKG